MTKGGGDFQALAEAAEQESAARPGLALCRDWQGQDLAAIRRDLASRLLAIGIEEAEIETRHLLTHVLAPHSLAAALADPALVSWQAIAHLADLATERLSRKPLSQILGNQPFWTLDLAVTPDVLTPRADTEALVEAVLARRGSQPADLLDLGTGSGAILLALLSERPAWTGLGIDLSDPALTVARGNAEQCGLSDRARFGQGRWGAGLSDRSFDIIVSNPPYIVSNVLAGLAPEVRDHEPALALDGGTDGLDAYREIIADLPRLLRPNGLFALEIGYDQAEAVIGLAEAAGLEAIECAQDLAGHDRVVLGKCPAGDG